MISLLNTSDELFDPGSEGLQMPLPDGVLRADVQGPEKPYLRLSPDKKEITMIAPLPPGRLTLQYFFEMAYEGSSLEYRQRMPAAAGRTIFIVANSDKVQVTGPAFESRKVEKMGERMATVVTFGAVSAGATLDFTMTNLPSRDDRVIYGVVGASVCVLLWGVIAFIGARRAGDRRREALLDQLTALEEQREADKIDEEAYQGHRHALLTELRQIWSESSR